MSMSVDIYNKRIASSPIVGSQETRVPFPSTVRSVEWISQMEQAAQMNQRAVIACTSGDLSVAKRLFDESLAICEQIDPKGEPEALIHTHIATVYQAQGNINDAESELQKALQIYQVQEPRSENLAKTHYSMGNVLQGQGKIDEALKHYKQSMELYESSGMDSTSSQRKFHEALREYGQDLMMFGVFSSVSARYYHLGRVYRIHEKTEEFVAALEKAVDMSERFDPKSMILVMSYHELGIAYCEQGRLDRALHCLQRTVQVARELDPLNAETKRYIEAILLRVRAEIDNKLSRAQNECRESCNSPDRANSQAKLSESHETLHEFLKICKNFWPEGYWQSQI